MHGLHRRSCQDCGKLVFHGILQFRGEYGHDVRSRHLPRHRLRHAPVVFHTSVVLHGYVPFLCEAPQTTHRTLFALPGSPPASLPRNPVPGMCKPAPEVPVSPAAMAHGASGSARKKRLPYGRLPSLPSVQPHCNRSDLPGFLSALQSQAFWPPGYFFRFRLPQFQDFLIYPGYLQFPVPRYRGRGCHRWCRD